MSMIQFAKIRVIRLFPLLFIAMVSSLIIEISNQMQSHVAISYKIFLQFFFGIFLLPHKLAGNSFVFPLDPPAWSLLSEILVNFAYAAAIIHFKKNIISYAALCSFFLEIYLSFSNVVGGVHFGLSSGAYCDQISSGLIRCSFSFSVGVLLYRFFDKRYLNYFPKISGLWLGLVLFASFLPGPFPFHWVYDLFCVFVLYPLIVVAGSLDSPLPTTRTCSLWLGSVSYPIYVIHYPLLGLLEFIKHTRYFPALVGDILILVVIMIAAWLILVLYDIPIRRRLRVLFLSTKGDDSHRNRSVLVP